MTSMREKKDEGTFSKKSSRDRRDTIKGVTYLPHRNTSVKAPLVQFIMVYSILILKHIFSPQQDIDNYHVQKFSIFQI